MLEEMFYATSVGTNLPPGVNRCSVDKDFVAGDTLPPLKGRQCVTFPAPGRLPQIRISLAFETRAYPARPSLISSATALSCTTMPAWLPTAHRAAGTIPWQAAVRSNPSSNPAMLERGCPVPDSPALAVLQYVHSLAASAKALRCSTGASKK
jgi:hypothetical protein